MCTYNRKARLLNDTVFDTKRFRLSEYDVGANGVRCWKGKEGEVAGRDGERLTRKACRWFPLELYYNFDSVWSILALIILIGCINRNK